jgi:hypothetical protein
MGSKRILELLKEPRSLDAMFLLKLLIKSNHALRFTPNHHYGITLEVEGEGMEPSEYSDENGVGPDVLIRRAANDRIDYLRQWAKQQPIL